MSAMKWSEEVVSDYGTAIWAGRALVRYACFWGPIKTPIWATAGGITGYITVTCRYHSIRFVGFELIPDSSDFFPREWLGEPSEYFFSRESHRENREKLGKKFRGVESRVGKILKSAHFRFGQNSAGDECCCQLECCSPLRMHQDG